MALKKFIPTDIGGGGRTQVAPSGGYAQGLKVFGEMLRYPWEGTIAAAGQVVEFEEPVRSVWVYATVDCYIAGALVDLATPAVGRLGDRSFVKAGSYREFPLYQNQLAIASVGGGGTAYLEGRV